MGSVLLPVWEETGLVLRGWLQVSLMSSVEHHPAATSEMGPGWDYDTSESRQCVSSLKCTLGLRLVSTLCLMSLGWRIPVLWAVEMPSLPVSPPILSPGKGAFPVTPDHMRVWGGQGQGRAVSQACKGSGAQPWKKISYGFLGGKL